MIIMLTIAIIAVVWDNDGDVVGCIQPWGQDLARPNSWRIHGRLGWFRAVAAVFGSATGMDIILSLQWSPSHCEPSCGKWRLLQSLQCSTPETPVDLLRASNSQTFSARCKVAAQPTWQHHHLGQQLDSWMVRFIQNFSIPPVDLKLLGGRWGSLKMPQKHLTVAFFPPVFKMIEKWNPTEILPMFCFFLFE